MFLLCNGITSGQECRKDFVCWMCISDREVSIEKKVRMNSVEKFSLAMVKSVS